MESMFIRIDVGTTPTRLQDQFAAFIRDEVVPVLRELEGYRSTVIGVDRGAGTVTVTTAWNTPEDRAGCDAILLSTVLENAGRFELVPVRIELYEGVFEDRV
jgi:hypothetical protein